MAKKQTKVRVRQHTRSWAEMNPEQVGDYGISNRPAPPPDVPRYASEVFSKPGLAKCPAPVVPVFMSTDSNTRKLMPVASGCLNYFPDALLCVSFISRVGNDKHNPGQPLHWAKEKSTDEPDAEVRHMLDHFKGDAPDPGLEQLGDLGHLASKAWRALAHLQRACDAARKAAGR